MADNLTELIKEHRFKIGFVLIVLIGLASIAIAAYAGMHASHTEAPTDVMNVKLVTNMAKMTQQYEDTPETRQNAGGEIRSIATAQAAAPNTARPACSVRTVKNCTVLTSRTCRINSSSDGFTRWNFP